MKINFKHIFLIFALSLLSQPIWSQGQSVSQGGMQFSIPADWFYQTRSSPNGNETINSGKKGEQNSFTINKINSDLSTKEGVDLAKAMTRANEFFKTASYTNYKNGMFNGYPSTETTFSNELQGTFFKGKMMAFKKDQVLYLIMYMGSESYFNGKLLQNILSSVRAD